MSKRIIAALVVGMLTAAGALVVPQSANAADLQLPRIQGPASWCGRCGCLHVSYDRHRELESTYGVRFDPRSFDTTEPHYYLGRLRSYPRYSVDADLAQ